MFKKFSSYLVLLLLVFFLAACPAPEANDDDDAPANQSESVDNEADGDD
jgi:PBP1b-binding outer membrane lipoprotein LpoB